MWLQKGIMRRPHITKSSKPPPDISELLFQHTVSAREPQSTLGSLHIKCWLAQRCGSGDNVNEVDDDDDDDVDDDDGA